MNHIHIMILKIQEPNEYTLLIFPQSIHYNIYTNETSSLYTNEIISQTKLQILSQQLSQDRTIEKRNCKVKCFTHLRSRVCTFKTLKNDEARASCRARFEESETSGE